MLYLKEEELIILGAFMRDYSEDYRHAVEEAIKASHAQGVPVYQCKDGYIIAIYPNGREVKLQKAKLFHEAD